MDTKSEFLRLARLYIDRDGIEDLLEWLETTDFFTCPASTRYHGAFEGGLVLHSLNVFTQLKGLCQHFKCDATPCNVAIVSLFHDLCKIGTYKVEQKWRKDVNNKWESYNAYVRKEDFKFGGHGSKSVYLVQHFMKLDPEEAAAINCHMGQWEATQYGNPSEVYEENRLAWLLHVADEAATYINDKEVSEDGHEQGVCHYGN